MKRKLAEPANDDLTLDEVRSAFALGFMLRAMKNAGMPATERELTALIKDAYAGDKVSSWIIQKLTDDAEGLARSAKKRNAPKKPLGRPPEQNQRNMDILIEVLEAKREGLVGMGAYERARVALRLKHKTLQGDKSKVLAIIKSAYRQQIKKPMAGVIMRLLRLPKKSVQN